jgi:hypothetical protein
MEPKPEQLHLPGGEAMAPFRWERLVVQFHWEILEELYQAPFRLVTLEEQSQVPLRLAPPEERS